MQLRAYLSVPYILEAETIEVAPGSWICRVSYPELPGCNAESLILEDALHLLERRRIETILRMISEGRLPPVPRPPLADCDPVWVAQQAGFSDETAALIARNERSTDALAPR